jgi:alpha-mannosidase
MPTGGRLAALSLIASCCYQELRGWEQAETVRRAAELNQPPIALVETDHAGALRQRESCLSVDQANIVVSAVKQAEDGDDLVIRCYEAHKVATHAVDKKPIIVDRHIVRAFAPGEGALLRKNAKKCRTVIH